MPLLNGVNPDGRIGEICPDASLMGNRGILHDSLYGPVVRDWQHKAWVACRLDFGGWQRGERVDGRLRLMAKLNEYSELFFLDEATALSAGHRPCGTCRKNDYTRFKSHWCQAKGILPSMFDPKTVDGLLHEERCGNIQGNKDVVEDALGNLPDGAMFLMDEAPCLLWKHRLWRWGETGYTQLTERRPAPFRVRVLTPPSVLDVLRAGYPVQVHKTAAFA